MNKLLNSKTIPYNDLVHAMYPFGSRVYGNLHTESDWDYFLILRNNVNVQQLKQGKLSYTIQTIEGFQQLLNEHEAIALECYFLPENLIAIKPFKKWYFSLKREQLKKSFLQKMEDCFIKSKRKFNSNNELIGKKSLFHSIRIGLFGLQILEHSKIIDYAQSNKIWESIYSIQSSAWMAYEFTFEPIYKKLYDALLNEKKVSIDEIHEMLPKDIVKYYKRRYEDDK